MSGYVILGQVISVYFKLDQFSSGYVRLDLVSYNKNRLVQVMIG